MLGICQAACHVAALRGWRFSVVTTLAVSVPILEENIARYGFAPLLGRVRASDVPVKVLATEADLEGVSLADVVLPVPGHAVQYPTHDIGGLYATFTAAEGIDLSKQQWRGTPFDAPGAYRPLICIPSEVSYTHLYYTPLSGDEAAAEATRIGDTESAAAAMAANLIDPVAIAPLDGVATEPFAGAAYAGLLAFTLPSSTYATMAVREVFDVVEDASASHGMRSVAGVKRKREAEDKAKA